MLPLRPESMEEEHRRRIDDAGAGRLNQDQHGASATTQQGNKTGDAPAISACQRKRKVTDIYDESRLDRFVDDASAMQDAIKDVLDKASSPETSKKIFLRSQLQHLHKGLVGIAEATYLDMLSKILMQSPEILDAVFQTDRSNKILESLAEKLPDDVVEAEQQAACLDAVVDANTELGEKTTKLTQMMVEYMIDTSRKERRVSERPRIVQDPSLPARSHGRSHH